MFDVCLFVMFLSVKNIKISEISNISFFSEIVINMCFIIPHKAYLYGGDTSVIVHIYITITPHMTTKMPNDIYKIW